MIRVIVQSIECITHTDKPMNSGHECASQESSSSCVYLYVYVNVYIYICIIYIYIY